MADRANVTEREREKERDRDRDRERERYYPSHASVRFKFCFVNELHLVRVSVRFFNELKQRKVIK